MTEKTGSIPIEKLASNKMEIVLPIPTRFIGTTDLKVGAIDDNGALEVISSERITIANTECLRFVASHFSPYVIFHIRSITSSTVETINAEKMTGLSGNQIAGVVRTINKSIKTIEVKWFFIVILFSAASILFLWKEKKNIKKEKK